MGVCLVDQYDATKTGDEINKYLLANGIQTNYRWAYNPSTGNYENENKATLVAGNYIFYAPYNANHVDRSPLQVVTPITQPLKVVDGKIDQWSAVNTILEAGETPFFVSYAFLSPDRKVGDKINIQKPQAIFSFPKVTVRNTSSKDIKVCKIALKLASGQKYPVKANLGIGELGKAASNAGTGVVSAMFNATETEDDAKGNELWGVWSHSYEKAGGDANLNKETTQVLTGITAYCDVVILPLDKEITVAAEEEIAFNVVLPGQAMGKSMTVYLYTNETTGYNVTMTNTANAITTIPGEQYLAQDFSQGTWKVAANRGKMMTCEFDDADVKTAETIKDVEIPVVVDSKAQLLDELKRGEALTVIATSTLTIDQEVIDAMRKVEQQSITVKGDVLLKDANVTETIVVEGATEISGEVTLDDASIELEKVTVDKGAELTLKAGSINNPISNDGLIVEDEKNAISVTVKNTANGTATETENVTIDRTSEGTNYITTGTLSGELKGNWIVTGDEVKATAVVVPKNKKLTVQKGGYLSGTITVNANGELVVDEGGTLAATTTLKGKAGYVGTGQTQIAPEIAKITMNGTLRAAVNGDINETPGGTYTGNSNLVSGWYNQVLLGETAKKKGAGSINSNVSAVLYMATIDENFDNTTDAAELANVLHCEKLDVEIDAKAAEDIEVGSETIEMLKVEKRFDTSGEAESTSKHLNLTLKADGKLIVGSDMTVAGAMNLSHNACLDVKGTILLKADFGENCKEIVCGSFVTEKWGKHAGYGMTTTKLQHLKVGNIELLGYWDLSSAPLTDGVEFTGGRIEMTAISSNSNTGKLKLNGCTVTVTGNTAVTSGTIAFQGTSAGKNNIELGSGVILTVEAGAELSGYNGTGTLAVSRADNVNDSYVVLNGLLSYTDWSTFCTKNSDNTYTPTGLLRSYSSTAGASKAKKATAGGLWTSLNCVW